LAIHVARRIRSKEALEVFADLMVEHGVPQHIPSDNVLPIEVKFFGNKAAPGSLNAAFRSYIVDLSPADSA
jgi:hypothetical protein